RAVRRTRDRVDRQVAPLQILLEGDVRPGVTYEAGVPGRNLAFRAREGVLLVRLRMQEDRKVAPDLAIAEPQHFFRRATDHDPIALAVRQTEQRIADRTADEIDVHSGNRSIECALCYHERASPPTIVLRRAGRLRDHLVVRERLEVHREAPQTMD